MNEKIKNMVFTLEHKILIIMYLITYPVAMFIQVRDPDIKVDFGDWILSFFANLIGAALIYFIVEKYLIMGVRFVITVFLSLYTYRIFKFILSKDSQEDVVRGFRDWASRFFKRISKFLNDD